VSFGYLIPTGLMAVFVLFAVAPPRPRRSSPVSRSFWLGFMVNELPFLAFFVLAASTALAIGQGDIANPVGWIGLGLAVLATAGLVVVVLRAIRTGAVVDEALSAAGLAATRASLSDGQAGSSTSLDLYSLRLSVPNSTSSISARTVSSSLSLSPIASESRSVGFAPRASSTLSGSGGSCFTPEDRGWTRM
jgi:hypothetical protein